MTTITITLNGAPLELAVPTNMKTRFYVVDGAMFYKDANGISYDPKWLILGYPGLTNEERTREMAALAAEAWHKALDHATDQHIKYETQQISDYDTRPDEWGKKVDEAQRNCDNWRSLLWSLDAPASAKGE